MKHQIKIQDVPRETYEQAEALLAGNNEKVTSYIDRLLWWNNKISLISRTISKQELREHVIHSIIPVLILQKNNSLPEHIIDCGTGGGLPGIPIAICFPKTHVTLNDISIKKILAVKDIVRYINIDNVVFLRCDVRSLNINGSATVFSKHAFKINFLVNALQRLHIDQFIFYKGGEINEELDEIDQEFDVVSYNLTPIDEEFFASKLIAQITVTPKNE